MARLSTPTAPVVHSINDSTPLVLSPELNHSLSSRDGASDAASDADDARRRTPVVEFGRRVENLGALMADADDDEQEPARDGGGGSGCNHGSEDEGHADEVVAMSKTLDAKMMKALNAGGAGTYASEMLSIASEASTEHDHI